MDMYKEVTASEYETEWIDLELIPTVKTKLVQLDFE